MSCYARHLDGWLCCGCPQRKRGEGVGTGGAAWAGLGWEARWWGHPDQRLRREYSTPYPGSFSVLASAGLGAQPGRSAPRGQRPSPVSRFAKLQAPVLCLDQLTELLSDIKALPTGCGPSPSAPLSLIRLCPPQSEP